MRSKKADMSMSVVVSAVLAVLILAVLSYMFIRGASQDSNTIASCSLRLGECVSTCTDGKIVNAKCPSEGPQVCCVSLGVPSDDS